MFVQGPLGLVEQPELTQAGNRRQLVRDAVAGPQPARLICPRDDQREASRPVIGLDGAAVVDRSA